MQYKSLFIYLILVCMSCTTKKPIVEYKDTTESGINFYESPSYLIEKNKPVSVLSKVLVSLGAGYLVYDAEIPIEIFDDQDSPNDLLNGGIASLITLYGLGFIESKIYTEGKTKNVGYTLHEKTKWLKKYDKNSKHSIVDQSESKTLIALPNSLEQSFTPSTYLELKYHYLAFKNEDALNNIASTKIENFSRNELKQTIDSNLPLRTTTNQQLKKDYILSSPNLTTFISSLNEYPNSIETPENIAVQIIESLDDVALYFKNFGKANARLVNDRAQGYVNDAINVIKYDQIFKNAKSTQTLLKTIIPSSNEEESKLLLKHFPTSEHYQLIQIQYLSNSETINTLLDKKSHLSLLGLKSNLNLYKTKDVMYILSQLQKHKNTIGFENAKRLVKSTQSKYVDNIYRSVDKDDNSLNSFIQFINENNKWIGAEHSNNIIKKAKNQIYLNNKAEVDRKNEVDNIYNYVFLEEGYINELKGDDLTLWQNIWSSIADAENKNVFISGYLVNYGNLPKTVKLTTQLNMQEETKSIWGHSIEDYVKAKDYFCTLAPGEKHYFTNLLQYTKKYKNEYSIWGQNFYEIRINQENPVENFLEYYDEPISESVLNEQKKLVSQYQNAGNIGTKSGYKSAYAISSEGNEYTVLSQSNSTYVDVKVNVSRQEPDGCIKIYSDGDEDYGYYSKISSQHTTLFETNDAEEDNYCGCFSTKDFPLTVEVSYISKNENNISTTLKLIAYKDYEIKVVD